ncbi:hypothetical protein GRI62_12640 [Erythrobacter arachoides]|uniref:Uncharacterized protein n=1 Tax=Aurantiacibacter arachoides TaxID=1850444 RepID=A0A845A413_9SPHN|nr:hypothetical protein [Aurantiacibacter arachoides]MXO94444.1 hypothetical protein [Aurantiacibacter arachoides]GGD63373.1 hypothetical protein GCM10011411_24630 [Aurantiacibacter arachoides]
MRTVPEPPAHFAIGLKDMNAAAILFLQAVGTATPAAPAPPPDIEFNARIEARRVDVRQGGDLRAEFRADPGEAPPVQVERSDPRGQRSYRNLTIRIHGEATLIEPVAATRTPQQQQPEQGTPTDENDPL